MTLLKSFYNTEGVIMLRVNYYYALFSKIGYLLLAIICFVCCLILDNYVLEFSLAGLYFTIAFVYFFFLERSKIYTITREQIIYERGIFNIKTDYIELYRIKDFIERRPLLYRFIGVFKVTLKTSDISFPEIQINGLPDSPVVRILRELVDIARIEKRVFEVD